MQYPFISAVYFHNFIDAAKIAITAAFDYITVISKNPELPQQNLLPTFCYDYFHAIRQEKGLVAPFHHLADMSNDDDGVSVDSYEMF